MDESVEEVPPLFIDAQGRVATLPPPLHTPLESEEEAPSWRERLAAGERYVGRILRGGALASGALFVVSVAVRLLPVTRVTAVMGDLLEEGAVSLLLVTPVARMVASGVLLGAKGEWRYALYAAGVVTLLGLAVGARFHG